MNNSIEGFMLNKKYRLIERIGLGGTAIVFKGEDVRTGETVAIKILKEEYAQDEEFIRRFRKEAEAAMKLNHPNIVSVKDIGQDGNVIYIVMEYVDGVTLKDYIDAMQYISWQDTLVIAKQILEAVDHAHEKQIIHRDIKPMNIMVSDSSDIKLTDFGIARAVSNSTIQANDNSAGSVHYLSPEQARGGFVDERSDIYSIGITLYELITGVVPFDGDSHISIALKHLDGKIIPPKEVDPEIPKGVNDLIVMATRKDPGKRFQSARDMLSRLYKVIENPHHSFLDEEYEPAYEPVDTALMENAVREVDEVEEVAAEPEYPYVNTAEIVRSVTMKTITYIISILAGIGVVIFIAGLTSRMNANINGLVSEKYVIEDYVGLRADDVVPILKEYGINVVQNIVNDDILPSGYIVSQNVEAGTSIKKGDKLQIEVSGGEGDFVLEDYKNEDYRLVEQALESKGVHTEIREVTSNSVDAGKIVRTSPMANTIVSPGDTVILYKSIGIMSKKVTVPNLIGLTLEEAMEELERLNLKTGKVYPFPDSDITDLFPDHTPAPTPTPTPTIPVETETPTPEPPETEEPESTPTPPETEEETPTPTSTYEEEFFNIFNTPEPTEGTPEPTEPTPEPTPTKDPSRIYASDKVVYQYPAPGTTLNEHEFVDLYFYDFESLREYEECILLYPYGIVSGRVHVRIDSTPADGLLSILVDGHFDESDFPIKYMVPKSFRGKTKVVIRLNRNPYMEQHV